MAALAAAVAKLKGRWLVTLNDSEANRAAFSGCTIQAVSRNCGIEARAHIKTAKKKLFREILITPGS